MLTATESAALVAQITADVQALVAVPVPVPTPAPHPVVTGPPPSVNTISALDPDPSRKAIYAASDGQKAVTAAQNGMAWIPDYGALGSFAIGAAGGDNDYWGNEVYVYDIAPAKWSRINSPSLSMSGGKWNGDPMYNATYAEYGDGTPAAGHTYAHLAYAPGGKLIVVMSEAAYGLGKSGYAHVCDLATGKWWQYSVNACAMWQALGTCAAEDTRRGGIVRLPAGGYHSILSRLDWATRAHIALPFASSNVGQDPVMLHAPEIDLYLVNSIVGDYGKQHKHQFAAIDPNNTAAGLKVLALQGDTIPSDTQNSDGTWNVATGSGLTWAHGSAWVYRGYYEPNAMYQITPPASSPLTNPWTIKRILLLGMPTLHHAQMGVFGRWRYAPSVDRIAYVASTLDPVVWLALP